MTTKRIKATAAILREKGGSFRLEDVTFAQPGAGEVLVRIVAAGMCHTDLLVREEARVTPLPVVLGHEGAGVVEAVGMGVTTLIPGDHVVLTYMSCGDCRNCRSEAPAYCQHFFALNLGCAHPGDGNAADDASGGGVYGHYFGQSSFSTYSIAAERNAVKVRRDAPLELMGALGCGFQTGAGAVLNALAVKPGSSIAIFGAGAVGLAAVMAARIAGASCIIAVDPVASRRAMALTVGATLSIVAGDDAVSAIREMTGGGADYTLECTGLPIVVEQAIDALGSRGTCGIAGAPPSGSTAAFDINALLLNGKSIRGILEGDSVPDVFIPKLVDFYVEGAFPIDKIVRFYAFSQIERAAADSISGATIKPILRMTDIWTDGTRDVRL